MFHDLDIVLFERVSVANITLSTALTFFSLLFFTTMTEFPSILLIK